MLPGGANAELLKRLNAVLETILKRPSVREQFARLGAEPRESTPAEYADFIKSEIARTARIVREAKITLD
jgi:tripartite-type tricarboxylate transporter receptor subunit TctC